MRNWIRWTVMIGLAGLLATGLVTTVVGAEAETGAATTAPAAALRTAALGGAAAFAIALSVIGAGYAVGRIGAAALGAAAEKPELLTRSILFVALAEGLAVLGFAIAMMLVQKI